MAPYEAVEVEEFAQKSIVFADDAVDNLNFPPRNISKQSVKIITKLQFFFIRLKKMLNLLSE